MMLRGFALFFAVFFILIGVVGFIPLLTSHQLLLNSFVMEPLSNGFYLLTGLVALLASRRVRHARLYFKVCGLIYALMAILGFSLNGRFGLLQLNLADSFLYLAAAMIALYLGFTSTSATVSRFA